MAGSHDPGHFSFVLLSLCQIPLFKQAVFLLAFVLPAAQNSVIKLKQADLPCSDEKKRKRTAVRLASFKILMIVAVRPAVGIRPHDLEEILLIGKDDRINLRFGKQRNAVQGILIDLIEIHQPVHSLWQEVYRYLRTVFFQKSRHRGSQVRTAADDVEIGKPFPYQMQAHEIHRYLIMQSQFLKAVSEPGGDERGGKPSSAADYHSEHYCSPFSFHPAERTIESPTGCWKS